MFSFTEIEPRLNVLEAEFLRLLGFPPGHEVGERPRELADWARRWYAEHGRPWIFARSAEGLEIVDNNIYLGGTEFFSERLVAQLRAAKAHDAMLVAVSAGAECETYARECWEQGRPDEYFFLEMFGSAVVEYLVTHAAGRVCGWAEQNNMAVLPHYSPGYTGWPVSDQPKLWNAIRTGASLPDR